MWPRGSEGGSRKVAVAEEWGLDMRNVGPVGEGLEEGTIAAAAEEGNPEVLLGKVHMRLRSKVAKAGVGEMEGRIAGEPTLMIQGGLRSHGGL
jgi:hypothetical protein